MTAPLLPVDACGECVTAERSILAHPCRVEISPGQQSLRAWYRCPNCRFSWWTSWSIDALGTPCPGCPACAPVTTGGAR